MRDIYFIQLDGRPYGIWKDEVSSVREVPSVHRLPLSPAAIAGVAVLDGKSAAVADLSVCMGLRPIMNVPGRRVLAVAGRGDGTVFLAAGELAEGQVPGDAVHVVPSYLRTDDADTCVVRNGTPVPVINIIRLHDRLQQHSSEPLRPSLAASHAPERSSLPTGPVRIVTAGKELFGISEAHLAGASSPLSGLAAVSLTPRHVAGMAFHDGKVIPVLRIAERLGLSGNGAGGRLLVAGSGDGTFGMVVEEEQGTLEARSFAMKALPPVAATGWCRDAAVSQGSIVPLLDPALLLSRQDEDDAVRGLPGRYRPEGRFAEAFERTSAEVLEFSLLGVRHALPKNEVEDILPFKSYRRLPGALPIVIGAAEHKGEVLPVLDLALVFGRRSLEKHDWSMILVRNGDFRALVITEDVFDERMLPREVQRKVPINLPHALVYGCYPEGVAVRLILNVEALAVHFDRAMVADLLPALTPEMAEAPAELVHALLPVAGEGLQENVQERAGATELTRSEAEERAVREEEERRQREEEERARQEEIEAQRREEAEREKAAAAAQALKDAEEQARREAEARAQKEEQERQAREEEEQAKAAAEEEARRTAEEEARLENERREAEEVARRESERTAAEAAMRAQQEEEERARQAAEEVRQRQEAEELRRREEAERSRLAAEEQARREAEEAQKKEDGARAARDAEEKARVAAEEQTRLAEEERLKRESEERERIAAVERSRLEAEAAQKAERERLQSEAEEQRRRDEQERAESAERSRLAAEEQARREAEEAQKKEEEARAARDAEEQARAAAEERARLAEEERLKREAEEQARRDAAERTRREEQEQRAREEAERTRAAAAAAARRAGESVPDRVAQGTPQDSSVLLDRVRSEQAGAKRKDGWKLPAAVAAALVILVLLFIGLSGKGTRKSDMAQEAVVRSEGPAVSGRQASEGQGAVGKKTLPPAVSSEQQAAPGKKVSGAPAVGATAPEEGTLRPKRAGRREERLVLTVPADRPMEMDVYIVKKGDTLWHICKRFTGNPFNYPRVARDNSIANPDLIFPDQRIELRK